MSKKTAFDPKALLEPIPQSSGVYIMRKDDGTIFYIGKAKNLRARVRSYFNGSDTRPFVHRLPKLLGTIDVLITNTEKEALILEATLIRKHKPRHNIALRDDKAYLQLRLDPKAAWPWVQIVRRRKKDGALYFGPYHSAHAVRETLKLLNRHFQLRTCRDTVLKNRSRPCLQYHIKRCPAPCVLEVDRDDYMQSVRQVRLFLKGRDTELVEELETQMFSASEGLNFERAARLRDQIHAIREVQERQQMVLTKEIDQDVFALFREGERLTIQLLIVRKGRMQGGETFHLADPAATDAELLSTFLIQYYQRGASIPREILLPLLPDGADAVEELLGEYADRRVYLKVPKRGDSANLVQTAYRNAEHQYQQHHVNQERNQQILSLLQEKLHLERFPNRIECYDISNFQGRAIVASMAVFIDGEEARKEYRTYQLQQDHQDDFAAMFEVITRRFRRVAAGEQDPPDLVVIDGGKGQLSSALSALEELGVESQVDIVSLAKSRTQRDGKSSTVTRTPERVFTPGRDRPIILKQHSDAIFLLQKVRDEAHRTAVNYHRKVRSRKTLRSGLDDIPGIGPKRRKALLKHFGSMRRIREASLEQLLEAPGISRYLAECILDHFDT